MTDIGVPVEVDEYPEGHPTGYRAPITEWAHPNEKVHHLLEVPLAPPDYHEAHRYQLIYLLRNDNYGEYRIDMGPVSDWPGYGSFYVWSLWENTVAECQEIADDIRWNRFWDGVRDEIQAESTLNEDALKEHEMGRKALLNQTIVGPGGMTQRDEVSQHWLQWRVKGDDINPGVYSVKGFASR